METSQARKNSAGLLFVITALFWSAQYSYTQFINPELERMGMSAAFMGLVSSVYGFTQMLLRLPLGILADKRGSQKPFVVMGCLLTTLAGAGFILFYKPGGFLVFRALAGAASASWVSFTVLYSSYFPHHEGPRHISRLNSANISGRLLGFLLILFIVPALGIQSAFWFSALMGVSALLLCAPLKETPHERQGITLKLLMNVSRDRYLLACSLIGILTQVVAFGTYYTFTFNAAKALRADSAMLTWLNIAMLIPTLAMNHLVTSHLLKRFSGRALVAFGFVLSAAYCLLVPLATTLPHLLAVQVLAGCTIALCFGVLIGQCVRDIPQQLRAVAMGFFQAVYGIGMTAGPLLMGLMIDASSLRTAFFAMAAFSLLSGALSIKALNVPPAAKNGGIPVAQAGNAP